MGRGVIPSAPAASGGLSGAQVGSVDPLAGTRRYGRAVPEPSVMTTPAPIPLKAGAVWRIETGLSFLTGVEMASAALRPDGAGLMGKAFAVSEVPFCTPAAAARAGKTFYSVRGVDHGTGVLPESMAQVEPAWLEKHVDAAQTVVGWKIVSAEMALHDYGVGSMLLRWEPEHDPDGDDLLQLVDTLNAAAAQRAEVVVKLVSRAFTEAVATSSLLLPDLLGPATGAERPTGVVLWVWNHCLLSADNDLLAQVTEHARQLCPNSPQVMVHRDHVYAAGVYTSVTGSRSASRGDAVSLSRALWRQDPWWTLFWLLDRRLLDLQLRLDDSIDVGGKVRQLERRAGQLAAIAERVRLYRSRVESMLVSAGARELEAWQLTERAWALDFRREVVERKLAQLDDALQAAIDHVVRVRAARISLMIYVFTALGVVASAVALTQFARDPDSGGLVTRLAILIGSTALSLFAVVLSLRVRAPGRAGSTR